MGLTECQCRTPIEMTKCIIYFSSLRMECHVIIVGMESVDLLKHKTNDINNLTNTTTVLDVVNTLKLYQCLLPLPCVTTDYWQRRFKYRLFKLKKLQHNSSFDMNFFFIRFFFLSFCTYLNWIFFCVIHEIRINGDTWCSMLNNIVFILV